MNTFLKIFAGSCLILTSVILVSTAAAPSLVTATSSGSQVTFSNAQIYFDTNSRVSPVPCSNVPGSPGTGTCDGGYYPDQTTASKLCQLKGYDNAVSFTTQAGFYTSCSDNFMWQWNGSGANYVWACSMNTGIDTVTCGQSPACTPNWETGVWSACSSSGTQTRTVNDSNNCGITTGKPATSQSCTPTPPTCTSWTYTDWSACSSSGTQTRTIINSYPAGCAGGSPVTSQSCTPTQICTDSDWTYVLSPSTCPSTGIQTKIWTKIGVCTGGVNHLAYETVNCNYQAPTCTSWTYTDWSACSSSGTQTRTVINSYPAGCAGGSPVTSQSCTPNNLAVSCYASPNPVNVNQSVSFICNVTGGTGNYNYLWSGACNSTSPVCTTSFSTSGVQTATAIVTSGSQSNSASTSVAVNQNNICTQNSYQQCIGNYLYWYNSCGVQQSPGQYCPNGCSGNSCNQQNSLSVQTNGATNISNNQATLNGYVYGLTGYAGSYYNNNTYVWFQWGTGTNYGNETAHQLMGYTGAFSQNVANLYGTGTYHFRAVAQSNNGQIVYGNDMTFSAGQTNGNLLTVTKTARNLTSGNSNWASTIYASPSDVLMFMITIQATGNQDAQNVLAKDYLASNLIYKNQLIVSGSNNYNYNYNGDITSGINLGTIPAGQTITITYQAQVAGAQNFAYGTTTLTNSVSVTSSNSGYNPTSNASVIVTRSAVYGASTISTGLTNNFWVDSFFLPLMLVLLGIWMMRSGMFFGIQKWVGNKKKITKGYKAEKELANRIAQIRQTEIA